MMPQQKGAEVMLWDTVDLVLTELEILYPGEPLSFFAYALFS